MFDGNSAFEPVISNLALECHAAVNILGADTKKYRRQSLWTNAGSVATGDEQSVTRIKSYLDLKGITYKDET